MSDEEELFKVNGEKKKRGVSKLSAKGLAVCVTVWHAVRFLFVCK